MTALIVFLLLSTAALVLFVVGVFLISGLPYALLAASAACLLAAGFVRKGIQGGGGK